MATPNVQNLQEKNEAFVRDFQDGHLPLPPAKKYLVVVRHVLPERCRTAVEKRDVCLARLDYPTLPHQWS